MPSVAQIADWQRSINALTVLAMRDINSFWSEVSRMDPAESRAVLLEIMPGLVRDYSATAGSLSADFYADSGRSGFRAIAAEPPTVAQVQGSVGWATYPLISGEGSALTRLAGVSRRLIFTTSRETTFANTRRDAGASWARYASANACPWCRMLATRGGVYSSERNANAGHDNCKCMAVPVRAGDSYEPPQYVKEWEQQYVDARATANSGNPNDIVNAWRKAI